MRQQRAFTLVELLAVIAIVALLVALLMPSLDRAKEITRRGVCATNLHHIGTSVGTYAADHNEFLPCKTTGSQTYLSCVHWIRWFRVNDDYWNLGLLYRTGIARGGGMFFCPSQPDKWFQLDTYNKPGWPSNHQSGSSANGVRISYAFDPYVVDPDTPDKSRLYTRLAMMPTGKVLACDSLERHNTVAHLPECVWNVLYPGGDVKRVADRGIQETDLRQADFAGQNFSAMARAVGKLERDPEPTASDP